MKILVGYDGSEAARKALSLAQIHAGAFDAEVHVLTSREGGPGLKLIEINRIETDLETIRDALREARISCNVELLIRGMTPGEDLVTYADENGIDEIIVGVEKRSKVGKLIFGSTAQYVILEASCPVVTVKPES